VFLLFVADLTIERTGHYVFFLLSCLFSMRNLGGPMAEFTTSSYKIIAVIPRLDCLSYFKLIGFFLFSTFIRFIVD